MPLEKSDLRDPSIYRVTFHQSLIRPYVDVYVNYISPGIKDEHQSTKYSLNPHRVMSMIAVLHELGFKYTPATEHQTHENWKIFDHMMAYDK